MEYTQKVSIEKNTKNKNIIITSIIASISLLGLVMAIYSIIRLKIIFALIYLVAVTFGLSYVIMKINTIIPIYLARKDGYLYIQTWEGMFPFRSDKGLIGEFLPSKTLLRKVDISAISHIYLGSRNYLLKLVNDGNFHDELINANENYENILKKMEFLYISTIDNREIYMSVTDFDNEELAQILKPVVDEDEKIDFKCNNRVISKTIPPKKLSI